MPPVIDVSFPTGEYCIFTFDRANGRYKKMGNDPMPQVGEFIVSNNDYTAFGNNSNFWVILRQCGNTAVQNGTADFRFGRSTSNGKWQRRQTSPD